MWLRSGNTYSANNFLDLLKDTLFKLNNKTVGLIRLDSSFFQVDILLFGTKNVDYVIAAKFTHRIQRGIQYS